MRRASVVREALISLVFAAYSYGNSAGLAKAATGLQLNPCAAPNEVGSSFEETAWQLWVAATCPVNRVLGLAAVELVPRKAVEALPMKLRIGNRATFLVHTRLAECRVSFE